nr:hypothetical protein [Tanacetum cinerariifolium]
CFGNLYAGILGDSHCSSSFYEMDNKNHIVNLESFREMLHICPRLPGQSFIETPFEEEILAFLWFLRHSGTIRRLTDGLYHKRNVDFAYLMWEDFVYQVEHQDTKKSNEMYYPMFTKVIIHHFMSKDPSILRRNKVNWHYVRDDHMFTMIKLVSRHQNTQQFGALLPIELTNADIRNSDAYKEYYAVATGATPPKPKASVRKTRSSSDTIVTPPTDVAGPRLSTSAKGKQPAITSKAKSLSALLEVAIIEAQQLKLATKKSLQQTHISQASSFGADKGTGTIPGVLDVPTDDSEKEISWNSTNEKGDDKDDDEGDDGDDGKEPESASVPKEKATRSASKSTQGPKSRKTSTSESATAEEPMQTTFEMEEPSHPDFETGADDQPIVEPSQHPKLFSQQKKPPTPDRDWNKTLPATHESIQPWISELAKQSNSRSSFNELMDTPMDFSAFLMTRLKVDTLTPELLAGPTYELMKGSCKSLVELEFFLEEVYKETTDQLDWVNPKGQQYPHNLLKPLPLIPNSRGYCVIPFDHSINNDLNYLRRGASSHKYTTFVTKTKALDYGHIKWIKDLVPRTMWIQEPVGYDKHAL